MSRKKLKRDSLGGILLSPPPFPEQRRVLEMMAKQISIRLNDEEEARLTEVCQRVSKRAGVRVDQTLVVKALIGFRRLKHLHEDDRTGDRWCLPAALVVIALTLWPWLLVAATVVVLVAAVALM